MNFETYLEQAWNDHPTQSEKVAAEFSKGIALADTSEQLTQMATLIGHVFGEHLGLWKDGISLLSELKNHRSFTSGSDVETAIRRIIAALQIGDDQALDFKDFNASDEVRVLAMAASALYERNPGRAQNLLQKALALAETSIDKKDPANRALAITGNNLACALEEKKSRSLEDNNLMILAAKAGRKYWELAGGWLEVSRAEYRLAKSYVEAENFIKALVHAQACVELCRENSASDLDMFFGYEALAIAEKSRGNDIGFKKAVEQATVHFENLDESNKAWCEPNLKKLI